MSAHRPTRARLPLACSLLVLLILGPGAPAAAASQVPARAVWDWPVAPPRRVVRGFEAPATPYSAGHRGIDVAAARGDPVLAPASGTVLIARRIVDRGVVTIDTGDGLVATLEPVDPSVTAGDIVTRGARIGAVGTGGHASGALHLGARLHGVYVSPLLYLGGAVHAVLLPVG